MTKKIAILEDNAERRTVMRRVLAERFDTFESRFCDEVEEMIAFLEANLAEIVLISLDNDLDMKPGPNGRMVDVGEGRQVAEFLAERPPVCPVILHTSNTHAAESMTATFRASGWKTRRVIPMDDTVWIEDDWRFAVHRVLVGPIKYPRTETTT